MNPKQPVRLYDFKEELITIPMVSLMAWKHGLAMELVMGEGKITQDVRKALGAPADYPLDALENHVSMCYHEIKLQILGE